MVSTSPVHDMIDVVADGDGAVSVCLHCDNVIARSADWRSGAGRSEQSLGGWAEARAMWIQPRGDTRLVELSCPACGVLLEAVVDAPDRLGRVDLGEYDLRVLG